jgi:16S rRNA (adenine1518-N6/adenine1519-N6)-dimethyltransferase
LKLQAKKSLGQNFLSDEGILRRIADAAKVVAGDTVLEIGPGLGALTKHLLSKDLSKLSAYEVDDRAIELLQKEFSNPRFELRHEDILQANLTAISEDRLRVVGNIPYYITSPIIFKLIDERQHIKDALLLVQLEVAERLTAEPRTKAYGIPTVLTNFFGEVKYLFKVKAGSFRPVPKVDSAVIHINFERGYFHRNNLSIPDGLDMKDFQRFVRQVFAMRRKTLRNNLKAFASEEGVQRMEADATYMKYLGMRAEELLIEDFLKIYQTITYSSE